MEKPEDRVQPGPGRTLSVPDALVRETETSLRRALLKMLAVGLIVLCWILLIHATPARSVLADIQTWKQRLAAAGGWGPLWFIMASALIIAGGFPRLAVGTLAGALFGFQVGCLAAWIAAGLGAYSDFLLARWGARDLVQRLIHPPARLREALNHPGLLTVVLVRQLPIWGLVQNMTLALTQIRHRTYLLGTLLGILPSTIMVTLIGSGFGKANWTEAVRNVTAGMLLLAATAAILWRLRNKRAALPAGSGEARGGVDFDGNLPA